LAASEFRPSLHNMLQKPISAPLVTIQHYREAFVKKIYYRKAGPQKKTQIELITIVCS
jgi:hypothetical protein